MSFPEDKSFHATIQPEVTEKTPESCFFDLWQKFKKFFQLRKQIGNELLVELEKSKDSSRQNVLLVEGEKTVESYDSMIDRVGNEAKLEIASLLGESDEIIEQIPPSQLKKCVWYNIPNIREEFRGHEEFMGEAERSRYEHFLDFDHIEQNQQNWREYLSKKIRENNVVCLGEAHTAEAIEKTTVAEFLEQARENGITDIGLEIEERLQEYFDRYLEIGKFQETDNPKDYEKAIEYQRLRYEWYKTRRIEALHEMMTFEETVADNFVFSGSLYGHYPLLKKARELGLRIHCIDANQRYTHKEIEEAINAGIFIEWEQQKVAERDRRMFENIKTVVISGKGKILVLLGSAHFAKGELHHKNLGDLLSEDDSIKSFCINMDRNLDTDITMQETKQKSGKDISLNSVLYTVLERRGIGQIGFDLDDSVLVKGNKQGGKFPFDGYVKIS